MVGYAWSLPVLQDLQVEISVTTIIPSGIYFQDKLRPFEAVTTNPNSEVQIPQC